MALNIKARSELDSADFNAGADKMSRKVKGIGAEATKLGSTFKTQMAGIGGSIAAAFTVGAFTKLITSAVALGSHLSDLAVQTGLTTDEIQAFEFQAHKAGVAPDVIRKTIAKLTVVMGQAQSGMKTYVDMFDKLNISQNAVRASTPIEMLEQIAKAMRDAKGDTVKLGAALEILGTRSGIELTQIMTHLADVGFGGFIREAKAAGTVISEDTIMKLDALADSMEILKKRLMSFTADVVIGFESMAEKIGSSMGALWEAIINPAVSLEDAVASMSGPLLDPIIKAEKKLQDERDKASARDMAQIMAGAEAREKRMAIEVSLLFKRMTLEQKIAAQQKKLQEELAVRKASEAGSAEFEISGGKIAQIRDEILTLQQKGLDASLTALKAAADERKKTAEDQEKLISKREAVSKKEQEAAQKIQVKREEIAAKEAEAIVEAQKLTVSDVVSDQLARIGGFMGGQISPQMRISQKQLIVEERMEKAMQESVKLLAAIERQEKAAQYE